MSKSKVSVTVADEPKPEPKPETPAGDQAKPTDSASSNISPAPGEVTEGKPDPAADDASAKGPTVQAEPLADGTVPTVLETGSSHRSVPKGKASITSIYRKADVITTVITFVTAVVASAAVFGVYAYLTRAKTPTTKPPTVTNLDKADLDKLGAFFEGNSAGNASQVLTINASTFFKNRAAFSSDLKVVGGAQVSGATALADLTVDKTSTLGITNIRGQLVVTGPVSIQSPAQLSAGASVSGNLAVSGNGSFGGSVSAGVLNVRDLSVSGTLSLNGHISIGGQDPTASPVAGVASSASVDGNDAAGTVTVTVPAHGSADGSQLVTVTFRTAYPRAPHVIITPIGAPAARFEPFVLKTATNFTIGAASFPPNTNATSYSFDYWVAQ